MSPECGNCGSLVTEQYVRVFAPSERVTVRVCPSCPDKLRTGGEIRSLHVGFHREEDRREQFLELANLWSPTFDVWLPGSRLLNPAPPPARWPEKAALCGILRRPGTNPFPPRAQYRNRNLSGAHAGGGVGESATELVPGDLEGLLTQRSNLVAPSVLVLHDAWAELSSVAGVVLERACRDGTVVGYLGVAASGPVANNPKYLHHPLALRGLHVGHPFERGRDVVLLEGFLDSLLLGDLGIADGRGPVGLELGDVLEGEVGRDGVLVTLLKDRPDNFGVDVVGKPQCSCIAVAAREHLRSW